MVVYVAGAAIVPGGDPAEASLEELVFEAAAAALTDAGTTRAEIDGVCLAASDQLDGRVISSMHLAGPAGGYLRDEVKVADDGSSAFAAAVLRLEAGASRRVLAVAWGKREKVTPAEAEAPNPSPLYERELGLHPLVAEALVAQMFAHRHGIPLDRFDELAARLHGDRVGNGAAPAMRWRRDDLLTPSIPPSGAGSGCGGGPRPVLRAGGRGGGRAGLGGGKCRPSGPGGSAGGDAGLAGPTGLPAGGGRHDRRHRGGDDRAQCLPVVHLGRRSRPGGSPPAPRATPSWEHGLPALNAAGGFAGEAMFAAGLERIAHAARAVAAGAGLAVAHSSYGRAGQGQLVTVLRRAT